MKHTTPKVLWAQKETTISSRAISESKGKSPVGNSSDPHLRKKCKLSLFSPEFVTPKNISICEGGTSQNYLIKERDDDA